MLEIVAKGRRESSLRAFLHDYKGHDGHDVVLFDLDQRSDTGSLNIESNLERVHGYLNRGARVVLVGLFPEHDYARKAQWGELKVGQGRVVFFRLGNATRENLPTCITNLVAGEEPDAS